MPSLTELALRNAKPKEKPRRLFDGGGLHLLANPDGRRNRRGRHPGSDRLRSAADNRRSQDRTFSFEF